MRPILRLGAALGLLFPLGLAACSGADEKALGDSSKAPASNAGADTSSPANGSSAQSSSTSGSTGTNASASSTAATLPPFGSTGNGGGSSGLGAACASDTDCSGGTHCLVDAVSALGDAAVGGGICTVDCSSDSTACAMLSGVCLGGGLCIQGCSLGTSDTVCNGRADMMCLPFNTDFTNGACVPMCQSNAGCGSDQECLASAIGVDPSTGDTSPGGGVCAAKGTLPPNLKKDGESCTASSECFGTCLGETDKYCISLCNFTSFFCNGDQEGDVNSVCWYALFGDQPLVNEPGLCTPTCDSDADCHDGDICLLSTKPEAITVLGHKGICDVPADPATAAMMMTDADTASFRLPSERSINLTKSMRERAARNAFAIAPLLAPASR